MYAEPAAQLSADLNVSPRVWRKPYQPPYAQPSAGVAVGPDRVDATPTAEMAVLSAATARTVHRLRQIRTGSDQAIALSEKAITTIDKILNQVP